MKNKTSRLMRLALFAAVMFISLALIKTHAYAQGNVPIPNIGINIGAAETPEQTTSSLQVLFVLAIISLAPFILLMLTCFTRIIIALHFLRSALGTQQMPPNQIMIGLALFLTFFIMAPTFTTINEVALQPYSQGLITQEQAIEEGMKPLRKFMIAQVEKKDVALFAGLANETYTSMDEISNTVLLPSFVLGEITKGFRFGFFIYMPFIVIDMVVASTLMAMGMMMLPPAMISLPFKVLLFVMIDGWNLVIENLVKTFK